MKNDPQIQPLLRRACEIANANTESDVDRESSRADLEAAAAGIPDGPAKLLREFADEKV